MLEVGRSGRTSRVLSSFLPMKMDYHQYGTKKETHQLVDLPLVVLWSDGLDEAGAGV